jgi:hypothetical protein
MNTEKLNRITLRVEKKLKNDFKRVALKNSRSVNAEILVAMQEHCNRNGEGISQSQSKTL